ncbi:hypothetical protein [Actinoplanes teichomyceticus]|uniref:Uncharacterized protein n=1 Tax=Actinoplanes teichomyceticus TaxID=1867 RepID=A0A561WAR8_ACTTI|nr:hypothetical protein [Actinoplanes teichomyceticus]TWG20958.1 hypothetical protein FHX34_103487 [Actinoplanes teichomyceticus]GIF16544.1 hypothetical protein Ate01nite_65760 [Actinoplanes teichomyceticus]
MTYEAAPEMQGLSVRLTPDRNGRKVITGIKLEADAITGEMLRKIPISLIENRANTAEAPESDLPPLRRTAGMSGEDFSRLVADHYKLWANVVPNPGAAMASKWGIKPPTVHTWIREARLRGLLAPARRGKGA